MTTPDVTEKPSAPAASTPASGSVAWYVEAKADDGTWVRMNEADHEKCTDAWMKQHNFEPEKWRIVKVTTEILWPPNEKS